MGGFEFTPFDKGEFHFLHYFGVPFLTYDTLLLLYTALDITMKWFLENYQHARIGSLANRS